MNDPGYAPTGTVELPCGARGYQDGCGVRCLNCLAIYGSVSCPCTKPKPDGEECGDNEVKR